jgi:hypothetical protein
MNGDDNDHRRRMSGEDENHIDITSSDELRD